MRLSRKLMISWGFATAVAISMVAVSFVAVHAVRSRQEKIVDRLLPTISALGDLEEAGFLMTEIGRLALARGFDTGTEPPDTAIPTKLASATADYGAAAAEYSGLVNRYFPDEGSLLDDIFVAGEDLRARVEAASNAGSDLAPATRGRLIEQLDIAQEGFLAAIHRAQDHENDEVVTQEASLNSALLWETVAIAVAGALGILGAVGAGFAVSRSLIGPLARLEAAARRIKEGDLSAKVPITSTDEVGTLSKVFNDMAHSLDAMLAVEHRRTEELRRLALIATSMHDGVCVTGLDGRIEFTNPALDRLLGYDTNELLGRPVADLYPGGNEDASLRAELQRIDGGGRSGEAALRGRNGGSIPVLETALPMLDSRGQLVAHLRVSSDLRSLKAEERAAQERIEAFGRVVSKLALGDSPDRSIRGLLDTARMLAGARAATVILRTSLSSAPRLLVSGGPPGMETTPSGGVWSARVLELTRNGETAVRLAGTASDAPLRDFQLDHWNVNSLLAMPLRTSRGLDGAFCLVEKEDAREFSEEDRHLANLFAIVTGVLLDNMELYQQVTQERQLLTAIQGSMTEGLAVLDGERQLIYFNRALEGFLGLRASDLLDTPGLDAITRLAGNIEPPSARESLRQTVVDPSGRPITFPARVTHPKNRELEITAFPVIQAAPSMFTGILVRDVTEEREIEQRHQTFVSMASHELRTPLTVVMGFAELLSLSSLPAERQEWARQILQESKRLTTIVDDLLNVSRIQSGKLKIELLPVALGPVADLALADFVSNPAGHEVAVEFAADLPDVLVDEEKLVQVLRNLLSNAVKYSPNGGRITVAATMNASKDRVVVSVADQGIGISQDDQKRLFTTFHRIRRAETEGIRGTGLGLYIVKELVEMMHGEVRVESELDRGSKFLVSLPIAPDA